MLLLIQLNRRCEKHVEPYWSCINLNHDGREPYHAPVDRSGNCIYIFREIKMSKCYINLCQVYKKRSTGTSLPHRFSCLAKRAGKHLVKEGN